MGVFLEFCFQRLALSTEDKKQPGEEGQRLLDVMQQSGIKLPTPKAIISYAGEHNLPISDFLFGEIKDLYMSLSFGQRQQFFTGKFKSIDEIAQSLTDEHGFNYEGEADFISDFAENIWSKKDTRFSFTNEERKPNNEELKFSGVGPYEQIAESQRRYDEVAARYKDTPLWMKAPNGQPTNLTEKQWVMVRTPNFKKWFGDWETLAIINELESMPATSVEVHEALDKAGIKEVFKSFGEVQNKKDGRDVVFPSSSAGKIKYHKGFNSSSIVKNFKSLFESAIPFLSEKEVLKDEHKQHRNYESYEHYVNKFTTGGNEYYIRFTVPVIYNNKGADTVHSSAVSEVAIYTKERASTVVSAYNNAESEVSISGKGRSSQFIDDKLSKFLSSVKQKDVSKVVDENGELIPLTERFNEYNADMRFSIKADDAQKFLNMSDEELVDVFNNVKKEVEAGKNGENDEAVLEYKNWLNSRKESDWEDDEDYNYDLEDDETSRQIKTIEYDGGWGITGFKHSDGYTYWGVDTPYERDDDRGYNSLEDAEEVLFQEYRDFNDINEEAENEEDLTGQEAYEVFGNWLSETIGEAFDIKDSRSKKSESKYITIGNSDFGEWIKFRFSGHTLPPYYEQKDFDIRSISHLEKKMPEIIKKMKQLANEVVDFEEDFNQGETIRFSFATVEKLKSAKPVVVTQDDYKGKYELNATSARNYVQRNLRGKKYVVADNGDEIEISQVGARKLVSHDRFNEDYLRTFAKIPEMIEHSIFLGERANEKSNDKYSKYRYYACGLKINGVDYTARLTVGKQNGNWYYDQALTKIEKGELIDRILTLNSRVYSANKPSDSFIDNRLISLLQENKSGKSDFSFADNDIHDRKRMHAIELAKKLYSRLGNDWDESQPLKISEYPRPTQEDKVDISLREMDFLDEDIQFVADRAEAILAKMIAKSDKRNLLDAVPEFELDFERQRVYDAIVNEAVKDYQKSLNLRERVKKQAENNLKKMSKSRNGFSLDELAINGIDPADAIAGFNQDEIEKTIDDIAQYCKKWASAENISYDEAFAKIKASFVRAFDDLILFNIA